MKSDKIYYLAHPYTGNEEENVKQSIMATNLLLERGFYIFNPLTHPHPLNMGWVREPKFWYDFDILFLNKCDGIIMSPGGENSKGCKKEFLHAVDMIKKGIWIEILFYEDIMNDTIHL